MDPATSHINTLSQVLSKLFSQGINFDKEVKALTLLSSLPVRQKVFCTTFANTCPKLNLDETIGQVLTEANWTFGKNQWDSLSMSQQKPTIEPSQSRQQVERIGRNPSRPRNRGDRQQSKSRCRRSSDCRKVGHNVSECWSIKRKENGRRFEQELRTIRLESLFRWQRNQCSELPIRRSPISRGLDDRRSTLERARRTNVAT